METSRPTICYVATVDLSLRFLLLSQMQYMQRLGFRVVAISSDGPYLEDVRQAGIPVHAVDMERRFSPMRDVGAFGRLVRALRLLKPDIVHTHTPKAGLLGRFAAAAARVPITIHTDFGLYFTNLSPVQRQLIVAAERLAAHWADAHLFEDPIAYRFAVDHDLCDRRSAKWIGGGIDLSWFRPDAIDAATARCLRHEAGFTDQHFVVGFVGRLVREKGILDLLDAAAIAAPRRPDLRLLVVGPQEDAMVGGVDVRAEISARKLDPIVWYAGPAGDVRQWYSMMDAIALPTHRDSWPRVPMEASAMGLPLIVTDLPGVNMAVRSGQNGIVVPVGDSRSLGDALIALTAPDSLVQRARTVSRAVATELFDQARVFERVRLVYEDLWSATRRDRAAA
jgi:glycosyltransferase involved in cell wall biosynthesis